MEDFFTLSLLILMAAAFIAGFVDAIAGGGGLITVPALLLVGVTPLEALATNKLQGIFGAGSAAVSYASKGHVDIRNQLPVAFACFLGAAFGAFASTRVPADYLRAALPIVLIAIALYFVFKRKLDDTDRTHLIPPFLLRFMVMPLVGFYDGLFGPGAGSFYMLAFVSLGGLGMLKATAHTKLLNFASNVGGFVVFAFIGVVLWKTGLMMGLSQFFGARLGATFAMRKGSKIIKPLLAIISILMALKLLSDPANPLRIWLGI